MPREGSGRRVGRHEPAAGVRPDPALFSASLLRVLDARARADVALSSRVHELAAGAALFSAGAPADALFVVTRGKLRLAGGVDPKTAEAGEMFGWDAVVPGAVRSGDARATDASVVVELPLGALRRGLTRSGAEELLLCEERRARLRSFRTLLSRTELGSDLGRRELDRLVGEAREVALAPGDTLGGPEGTGSVWLVVSGVVALAGGRDGYAARGHLVGLDALLDERPASVTAVALGDALVLALPSTLLASLGSRYPRAVERELAGARSRQSRQRRALGGRSGGGPGDPTLGRLEAATSLLAIDLGRCVDCGHCARACADTHGAPRFVRHGEQVVASVDTGGELLARAYLLPNACQHCKEPACLSECPTGAIVRDARGAIQIRTELCTGCAACVSACPWDAVELIPSGGGAVAAKCDLCAGREGPECVLACPTGAIVRVEPARDFAEVRVALGASSAQKIQAKSRLGPWLARAAALPPVAVALSVADRATASTRLAAGVTGAVLLAVLVAHAVVKRVPAARALLGKLLRRLVGERASLAPVVGWHTALGVLSIAAIVIHTGGRLGAGVAGALTLSYWLLVGTGLLGAALYLIVPRRLSRLEPGPDPAPDAAELDRRLFAALSGGNEAVKALAKSFLIPHEESTLGAVSLLLSGRGPEDEARALTAKVTSALEGRASARLGGLAPLVERTVAIRAARAARLGRRLLGSFVPVHLVLAVLLVALLVVHVLGAVR